MERLDFSWDHSKADSNRRKHGITFDEAATVFYDDNAKLIHDPDHSLAEDRYVVLGLSAALRMLVVCHTHRSGGATIRIISARKATAHEREQYMEGEG